MTAMDPKPRRSDVPQRLLRMMREDPERDLANRILRARIMTRKLARDGGIVMPSGVVTRFYEENPVVLARHGLDQDRGSPVIGRSLGLTTDDDGIESVTQFAETDLGREYAYLYGLSEKGEIYMRAWSFGWTTLDIQYWTLDRAKQWLGKDWEPDTIDYLIERWDEVWVAAASEMHEYSAVAVGADRDALSRAFSDGVNAAGEIINGLDLREARAEILRLRGELGRRELVNELRDLHRQIQALSRDGAAAARRGDSAAILQEVRSLARIARGE